MSIESIKSDLEKQKVVRNDNNANFAENFIESLFKKKDIDSNEKLSGSFDDGLSEIASNVSTVMSHINHGVGIYSFHNTYDSLSFVKNKTSEKFKKEIIKELERASNLSHERFKTLYKSNLSRIDTLIQQIENYIKEYNELSSEIERIESEISYKRSQAKLNNIPISTTSLESRKGKCKNRQKTIILMAENLVRQLETLNEQNRTELLEKGLKKA